MDNKLFYVSGFFLALAMLVYMLGSCSTVNRALNLLDKNPIEEDVEEFIHDEMGLDLELTLLTPE